MGMSNRAAVCPCADATIFTPIANGEPGDAARDRLLSVHGARTAVYLVRCKGCQQTVTRTHAPLDLRLVWTMYRNAGLPDRQNKIIPLLVRVS